MIRNALAEKLKRQSKDDFKGRQLEPWLIVQPVSWYLRHPLSYRDLEEMFEPVPKHRVRGSWSWN